MKHFNNILLIDDDTITNHINECVIASMQVANHILVATSGKEGLIQVQKKCSTNMPDCPDIILLDINMPEMDGFEFLRELKIMDGKADQIYVFMLTSSLNLRDMQSANCYHISGYISKPLSALNFSTALKRIPELI